MAAPFAKAKLALVRDKAGAAAARIGGGDQGCNHFWRKARPLHRQVNLRLFPGDLGRWVPGLEHTPAATCGICANWIAALWAFLQQFNHIPAQARIGFGSRADAHPLPR